jgi:hypothetical protein
MDELGIAQGHAWVRALRLFAGDRRTSRAERTEYCELCHAPVFSSHPHVLELATRKLLCACTPCSMLFAGGQTATYRLVPHLVMPLPDFHLPDVIWDDLQIPTGIAFFIRNSGEERILALYPGAGGAVQSMLELDLWSELVAANPVLADLQEDVEALLVNRMDGAREYYRVPIDRCYALAGIIRQAWQGISGGEHVREVIRRFFDTLPEGALQHA